MNGAGWLAALLLLGAGAGSAVAVHDVGGPPAAAVRLKPSFDPAPKPTITPCNGPASSNSRCTTIVIA